MYPLIETIKIIDAQPQNLAWHQKRFASSFRSLFHKPVSYNIKDVCVVPDKFSKGLVRARISYNDSDFIWEFEHYTQKQIRSLKMILDDHIDYSHKYKDRSALQTLYEKKGQCDDVLILKKNLITDTSYCNIVFFNGKDWITPATPLLRGTCRERLLAENKIREGIIRLDQLDDFTSFKLINAMYDFAEAEVLSVSDISYSPVSRIEDQKSSKKSPA